MKILLLSDVNSSHTQQWAMGLAERGLQIGIFSLRKNKVSWIKRESKIKILYAKDQPRIPWLGLLNNFDLFTYNRKLTSIIKNFQPDIIHAHGIGNHGLIAARSGAKPLISSAWGSDIMAHPQKSFLHRYFVQFALQKADTILATSQSLAEETTKYTSKKILLTPFGIDTEKFKPKHQKNIFTKGEIVLGSIKGLKPVYQHHLSLQYFAKLVTKHPHLPLRFLLVGEGPERKSLENLTTQLGIEKQVHFAGAIAHHFVPKYLEEIDILLNLSKRESFGVAVLEASAMEVPVIATQVGGLPEVVLKERSGFLVNADLEDQVLSKIEDLVLNPDLRKNMGQQGRKFVLEQYSKEKSLDNMIQIYKNVLEQNKQ